MPLRIAGSVCLFAGRNYIPRGPASGRPSTSPLARSLRTMYTRAHALIALLAAAFLAPIFVVLAWNKDAILDDLTPRPENGHLIYVTMDR